MRILHVVPSYLPAWRYGGPIRSVHGLARAQAARGDEVEVFTTNADGPQRLAMPADRSVDRDGVAVRYFALGRPARLFRAPAMAAALRVRVGEFDVVHLHSVFLWPTWRAARAAAAAGVPYVVSPRGILASELIALRGGLRKRLWIRLIERRTLREAAALHVTSEAEARDVRELGLDLATRLAVVPNGVTLEAEDGVGESTAPTVADRARARGPYWLYLGRISAKKGIDLLIAATAKVDGLRLIVAGNDDEGLRGGLVARAQELGVAERVEFLGEVRGGAVSRLLAGSVALALPSRSENFGNVVLESLAAGRPVVVTPEVGAAEVVVAAAAGRVVERSPEAFAAAVEELLRAPDEATGMGRRGREHVLRELSWERIAIRMNEVYEAALGGRAASAPAVGVRSQGGLG